MVNWVISSISFKQICKKIQMISTFCFFNPAKAAIAWWLVDGPDRTLGPNDQNQYVYKFE